jgi:membrane protease YdiL (CAAX protease family)
MTRAGPSFWRTVFVLLWAAQRRTIGRYRRFQRLNRSRGGDTSLIWNVLGFALVGFIAAFPPFVMAVDLDIGVSTAEQIQAEANGRVVVEEWFAGRTENHEDEAGKFPARRADINREENDDIAVEASRLADRRNEDQTLVEQKLRQTVAERPKALLSKEALWWQPGPLPDIFALIAVLWWALILICIGEDPELDVQRTRHPMWEWLFSHPAPPTAVFFAEMITPIATNPLYLAAPLMPALLYGGAYGWPAGVAAAILVGVPISIALAFLGKSIQIWILLRFSPSARGATLGVMAWFGFFSIFALFLITSSLQSIVTELSALFLQFAYLPWPHTRLLVGLTSAGNYVFWRGVLCCWSVSAIVGIAAVALAVVSTRAGLVGRSETGNVSTRRIKADGFEQMPLYRKELLWLRRDRSALVQTILVPVSLAALQVVNLRQAFGRGGEAWSTLCGVPILFGTYFLLTVGPRSLTSEGSALWIALTWPHGLESLLRAKAKLWAAIASVFVFLGLVYAVARYPSNVAQILLIAALWVVFSLSLAEKTTTLATTASSSGQAEQPPVGLRWAGILGTLALAVGVFTQQWSLMIAGVVYSIVTAAAMWETFRYRLPYLLDPWSQRFPPPPTMLHAMVAISGMVEAVALLSALTFTIFGRDSIAPINAVLYAFCAIVSATAVSWFLHRRGVRQRDIWLWPLSTVEPTIRRIISMVAAGAVLGAVLGGCAKVYLASIRLFPDAAKLMDDAQQQMNTTPHAHFAYAIMAIALAPIAEEFLFRGLLYRALDREWGGWRAIAGSAAFFAVYHPALSWIPVAALGAMNAVLYKRGRLLLPAVAAHMAYNAVIVLC